MGNEESLREEDEERPTVTPCCFASCDSALTAVVVVSSVPMTLPPEPEPENDETVFACAEEEGEVDFVVVVEEEEGGQAGKDCGRMRFDKAEEEEAAARTRTEARQEAEYILDGSVTVSETLRGPSLARNSGGTEGFGCRNCG